MKKKSYKRKRGDFEVRILPDGRVVMVAPDESMLEVARSLERENNGPHDTEKMNGGSQ